MFLDMIELPEMYVYHYFYISLNSLISKAISKKRNYL